MFVRTLIGREAGNIIDMPSHAAQACLSAGTAQRVTDEEITVAGLAVEVPAATPAEAFPVGYRVEADEELRGFYVLDAGGVRLNEVPLPNLAAARSLAHDNAAPGGPVVAAPPAPSADEVALLDLNRSELDELADRRKIDASKAKNKHDVVELLIAGGVTIQQLKNEAAFLELKREKLDALAAAHQVDVAKAKNKDDVVAALILADVPVPQAEAVDLRALNHDELVALATERSVDIATLTTDADIVAALELAAE